MTASRRFIAAPVFGRPNAAAQGKLFIVAAGEPKVIDVCMPLFDAMGQKTFRIGEVPQAANLVKLSGNFITASVLEAMSEAMALIRKAGIDPHRYFELLTSTIFTCPVFTNYGGQIATESPSLADSRRRLEKRICALPWPRRKRFGSRCRWRAWFTIDSKR